LLLTAFGLLFLFFIFFSLLLLLTVRPFFHFFFYLFFFSCSSSFLLLLAPLSSFSGSFFLHLIGRDRERGNCGDAGRDERKPSKDCSGKTPAA
jgi:hypothetical protein